MYVYRKSFFRVSTKSKPSIAGMEISVMISSGSWQQAISRAENNMHSPSLRLFCNMVNALGYEIEIVKKGSVQNTK